MKVPEIIERRRSMDCFAGAAELPSNPEKITPRSSFGKILLSSKDGVRDDKVGSLNLFTIVPTVDSLDNQRLFFSLGL